MRAILYHFAAVAADPGASVEIEWEHEDVLWRSRLNDDTGGYLRLVGATLRVRPVPNPDNPSHSDLGGYRLIDIDEDNPEALGKRLLKQLSDLRDAGAPYATIILTLDPDPT